MLQVNFTLEISSDESDTMKDNHKMTIDFQPSHSGKHIKPITKIN
jgi:hypothetical protein